MLDLLAQAEAGGTRQFIDNLARTPLSEVVLFVAICTVLRLAVFPTLRNTAIHKRTGFYPVAKFLNESLDAIVYAGVFVFMLIRPFVVQAFLIPSGSMVQTLQVNDFIVANKAIYRYSDPHAGDIVVFKPPKRALQPGQGDVDFIKRCVGTPGDVVEVKDNILFRNGKPFAEENKHFTREEPLGSGKFFDLTPEEMKRLPTFDFKLVDFPGRGIIPVVINKEAAANKESGAISGPLTPIAEDYRLTDEEGQVAQNLPPAKIPASFYLMCGDNRNNSFDGRDWGLVPRDDIIGRSEAVWWPLARWRITR